MNKLIALSVNYDSVLSLSKNERVCKNPEQKKNKGTVYIVPDTILKK